MISWSELMLRLKTGVCFSATECSRLNKTLHGCWALADCWASLHLIERIKGAKRATRSPLRSSTPVDVSTFSPSGPSIVEANCQHIYTQRIVLCWSKRSYPVPTCVWGGHWEMRLVSGRYLHHRWAGVGRRVDGEGCRWLGLCSLLQGPVLDTNEREVRWT